MHKCDIQASMFCDTHNMPMDGWMAGTAGFMGSHQAIFLWRDTLTLYRGPGLCCLFSFSDEHFLLIEVAMQALNSRQIEGWGETVMVPVVTLWFLWARTEVKTQLWPAVGEFIVSSSKVKVSLFGSLVSDRGLLHIRHIQQSSHTFNLAKLASLWPWLKTQYVQQKLWSGKLAHEQLPLISSLCTTKF